MKDNKNFFEKNVLYLNGKKNKKSGELIFYEYGKHINFKIKRIYNILNVKSNEERGFHAHYKTKQLLWCLKGSIDIFLDDGIKKDIIELNNPYKVLLVDKMVWHHMKWKEENSILMVAASEKFDRNDYIEDYKIFISKVKS